jgi:spore maturation protein CgeB
MKIAIIGLTISSSWGNGHATTYRGLVTALAGLGHEVYFLEHDKPWYKAHRDFEVGDGYALIFYENIDQLKKDHFGLISSADMVMVGSYVPDGVQVCQWVMETASGVKAFYDIDTPVTLQKLEKGDYEYLTPALIPKFDLYLSFSGGKVLTLLEEQWDAKCAKALYCSVDEKHYYPAEAEKKWLMGYLGTYSDDRQPTVDALLLEPARQMRNAAFVVAGPAYPDAIRWPDNVERLEHLPPHRHRTFYNSQHYTLNVTRQAMVQLGYSPSVRLFEAAACGVPIISDYWEGLTDLFEEGKEIMIARNTQEMLVLLHETTQSARQSIADAARAKVLAKHTAASRALELLHYFEEINKEYTT